MRIQRSILFLVSITLFISVSLIIAPLPEMNAALRRIAPQSNSDRITIEDFKALLSRNASVVILDVRGDAETKIKGALHIPLDKLESRLNEIPRDREIITYCA